MPGGRTKFQEKWLEDKDGCGTVIGSWCAKGRNEWEAYCMICNSHLSVSNGGISQLHQHTTRQKHIAAAKQLKGQSTLSGSMIINTKKTELSESLNSTDQLATKAEALWCMKVAAANFSFESCKDIVPVFKSMFENPIVNGMHLSERKVSYVLSHGLGPYFVEELISDLKASLDAGNYFTLSFDETTTSQVKKQLDLYLRFWSSKSSKIISAYLTSLFFGHATSDAVCCGIMDAMKHNKIPIEKMLMLSMDGPNVNLAISKKLNNKITEVCGSSELVDIGTCSLHKVHNCFSKALDNLPLDIDEFASDLFAFFRVSAARREDLKELEKLLDCEEKFLLRHVSSRWLTLGPVVTRILLIYPALEEYFLNFLPKEKTSWSSVQKNARYRRIVCVIKEPQSVVFLEFISSLAPYLQRYLTLFQTEGPLIHLLYNEMNSLLRSVMLIFMKADCVGRLEGKKLLDVSIDDHKNYKVIKDMNIGIGTIRALSQLKENSAKEARMAIRAFLVKLCKLLKESLPLTHGFLKDLERLLHPALRSSQNESTIRRLCVRLTPLKMSDQVIDRIVQEAQAYRLDEEVDKLVKNFNDSQEDSKQPIDMFWSEILKLVDRYNGRQKYQNLSILVKNCLSLSHGNSDVERGFSFNRNILSYARQNLSEAAIIGIRQVKDTIRRNGNICDIPITKKMINAVAKSHSAYALEKETKKKAAEDIKKKKRVLEEELKVANEAKRKKEEKSEMRRKIDNEIKTLQEDLLAAQNYMVESNQRLQTAIKMKNFADIKVASTAIEVGTKKVQIVTNELTKAQEKRVNL